jgi:hypothetical protein
MATKNLGNVRALISGTTAPTNKSLIWEDTSVLPYVKKIWNNVDLIWEPIATNVGAAVFFNTELEIRSIIGQKSGDTAGVIGGRVFKYVSSSAAGFDSQYCLTANNDPLRIEGFWDSRFFTESLDSSSYKVKKLNASRTIDSVYANDYDSPEYTLDFNENIIVLDTSNSVLVNGVEYIPSRPSIIHRKSDGSIVVIPIGAGSTSVIVIADTDAFDSNKIDGYPEGSIVSYVNAASEAPFNELAIYVASFPVPYIGDYPEGYVENPEQTSAWEWQGTTVEIPSGTGSTVFVQSTTSLQSITGYKVGDTVSVAGGYTYRYQHIATFEEGVDLYPFDQVDNPTYGWTYKWYNNELYMRPKINYSNIKYLVDGGDMGELMITLLPKEAVVLMDSDVSVYINEQEFVNTGNCIVYCNRHNVLVQKSFGDNTGGGHIIANESEDLPQRAKLRFTGSVSVTDNELDDETQVEILGGLISKTYAELQALVASNGLVQGQQYLLSDFRVRYRKLNTINILTGSIEPLILLAISTNSFHKEVKSTIYANDTIYYNFNGTSNYYSESTGAADMGVITRRIDEFNNSCPYDHRNILWPDPIDSKFMHLTFESSTCKNNTFGDNSFNNVLAANCNNNYFAYAQNNTTGQDMTNNTIHGQFLNNFIERGFKNNVILSSVANYTFYSSWPPEGSPSTHVFNDYNTTIFKNSSGVNRLSYYDANDQLVITDITA